MSISRKVWNARLLLLTVCVFCTIFNAPGIVTIVALSLLSINLLWFNPWWLAEFQAEEDAEEAQEDA